MLVAHAAIEPALRRLIARRLEVDSTEPLLGSVLGRAIPVASTMEKAAASDDLSKVASLYCFDRDEAE
jgi:hypothetical protein